MEHLLGLKDAYLALSLLAIDPGLNGVLISGPPGTGKTALARASRSLWPDGTPFVNLPLGATMDRLLGGIDMEHTLTTGQLFVAPGLLAAAHRGILYVDEINLLEPGLANAVHHALAAGEVQLERDGISQTYPSDFALVGTFNPAEGLLISALLDRVAFLAPATTLTDVPTRAFVASGAGQTFTLPPDVRRMVAVGRQLRPYIKLPDSALRELCAAATALDVQSNRAEIFAARCACANAALNERIPITQSDIDLAVRLVLLPRATRARQFSSDGPKANLPPVESPAARRQSEDKASESSTEREDRDVPQPEDQIYEPAMLEPDKGLPLKQLPLAITPQGGTGIGNRAHGLNNRRGRHIRSLPGRPDRGRLALVDTLKAAALAAYGQRGKEKNETRMLIRREDLRIKQFRRRTGLLFVFAVDASGSMALNRINTAKGAAISLLQSAYVHRDKVALLSFRYDRAEILLSPGGGVAKARRVLEAQPTGGRTPLSAALVEVLQLAQQTTSRGQMAGTVLVLITDGRANQPLRPVPAGIDRRVYAKLEVERLSKQLRPRLAGVVVIDTRRMFVPGGSGQELAKWLGAHYVYLPNAEVGQITTIVQGEVEKLR